MATRYPAQRFSPFRSTANFGAVLQAAVAAHNACCLLYAILLPGLSNSSSPGCSWALCVLFFARPSEIREPCMRFSCVCGDISCIELSETPDLLYLLDEALQQRLVSILPSIFFVWTPSTCRPTRNLVLASWWPTRYRSHC